MDCPSPSNFTSWHVAQTWQLQRPRKEVEALVLVTSPPPLTLVVPSGSGYGRKIVLESVLKPSQCSQTALKYKEETGKGLLLVCMLV